MTSDSPVVAVADDAPSETASTDLFACRGITSPCERLDQIDLEADHLLYRFARPDGKITGLAFQDSHL